MRSPTIKLFSEQISEANAQRDDAISRLSIAQQEIANKDSLLADKDSLLADKDSQLADKDREIAMLRAQLAEQHAKNDI